MRNLLKSKFLLGVAAVAIMFVGVVVVDATTASAIDCSTGATTLRVGSKGEAVKCLQGAVGATADGIFGPKTKAAVVAWQSSVGLVADGIFGPKSRAVLLVGGPGPGPGPGSFAPEGCTSASGYSPVTGGACYSVGSGNGNLPEGCTSTAGYSPITGVKCDSNDGAPVATGPVTVALASDNPAASTLVATQATADMAHFMFSGAGTVTNVTLKRIGVSADTTPSNVYLFDGATRLTDAASVSTTGLVSFNVPTGIFTVAGPKVISVKSDILTGTSGQTVGFKLVSFATASGTETVNLAGNIHSIASATLASVSAGTVTPSGSTINPASGITLWQSTLTISQRDVLLKRFSLRNIGSAPATAFGGFTLYLNGVVVGTATGLDANGYVTFDLSANPATLASGSRILRVDADIVSGASRTVQLSLRNAADVDFVDSSFGVNISPSSTPWSPSSASTISGSSGGSLTIVKDVSSPSTNLTLAGSDVVLGTFKLTAYGESIKVETLTAGGTFDGTLGSTSDAAVTLRNGRLLFSTDQTNWTQYGSTSTLVPAGTSFTTNYTVVPGTPVYVQVHSDIFDNDGTGALDASDTIIATLITGSSNAQRVDSLGSFNAPASNVSANTLTIATTSITLTKNGTYTNQNTALPATNFKIASYNIVGSSVEDVLLTTLSLDVGTTLVGAGFDYLDVANLYPVVKDGSGNIVAQPSPLETVTAANNSFSINYTLPKNANRSVEFYADLSDDGTDTIDATDSFDTVLMITGTSMVSGQSITAGNGTTTVAGQAIAYAAATITVSKDAASPVTAIVYANQTTETLRAKFTAVTAGYNVTALTVTLGNANAATVVQNVMLYDGTTLIAQAPMSTTTTATFSGLSWNVPANTSKVLAVKLQLGIIGPFAGTSGSTITTSIAAATDVVYTNTSTGVSTSSSTEEAGTATGSTIYAYAATPTITKVDLSATEAVLAAGTKVLARFDVTSNGGTVAWKQVLFDITKIAAPTIASPTLWDVTGGGNTQVTAAAVFQNGTSGVATTCVADNTVCELLMTVGTNADDNVEQQVSGTKRYEVRATIAGTLAAANSISTSIQSNVGFFAPGIFVNAADGADNDLSVDDSSFVWSDQSAQSHDTGTADWSNENLVKVLPTSTWTMTYPN